MGICELIETWQLDFVLETRREGDLKEPLAGRSYEELILVETMVRKLPCSFSNNSDAWLKGLRSGLSAQEHSQ